MFRKNTAGQHIHVQGVDATTGGILSGVTWTVRRCIDGTFAAAGGTATEDGTTGWYKFAMSQADTNGDNVGFNFTGTGAVPQTVNIITTVLDPTSAAFGLVIAKTTNITGFNDIAATAVVSAGAITTLSGAVVNVDTVDLCTTTTTTTTATNLTNLPTIPANWLTAAGTASDFGAELATAIWTDTTAGDFTVALSVGKSVMNGVALGTGLTVNAVTGLAASNLDTTISSRMATYAQPTGFLAATFPSGTIANTTNITAGTITTTTNLTNLPAITADWITATGIAADAGTELATAVWASAARTLTAATNITSTGGTTVPQTGDSFARIGAAGAGLTAVPWNAAWDAEVESEVDDALVVHRLDELLNADSDIDGAAPPTVGSVFHELLTKTAGSFTYDQTTDSLEALRDRGDAAWITAAGFATPTNITAATGITLAGVTHTGAVIPTVSAVTGLTAADVGAIRTQTDKLVFTVANQVDANLQSINDTALVGNGTASPWGPA